MIAIAGCGPSECLPIGARTCGPTDAGDADDGAIRDVGSRSQERASPRRPRLRAPPRWPPDANELGSTPMLKRAHFSLVFVIVSSLASACGGSVSVACGAGTSIVEGVCVAADAGASCGPGTTLVGGICLPSPTCGAGTILIGDTCVAATDASIDAAPTDDASSNDTAPVEVGCGSACADAGGATFSVRIGLTTIAGDGYSVIPVEVLGTNADGTPSHAPVVLSLTRPDVGSVTPVSLTLGDLGASAAFTPCNALTTPTCEGAFAITLALAADPTHPVASSVPLSIVAPSGVGSVDACAGPGTVAFLSGDATDFVHPGNETVSSGGTWSVSTLFGGEEFMIDFEGSDPTVGAFWMFEFGTNAIPAPFAVGTYTNAERAPFASAGHPGIDISGDGRGCNTDSGQFQVHEVTFDGTTLKSLLISFEQHCEGASSTLRGCLRYEAP
ncbi:MAG: hypothetical protein ACHREM_10275 [Polyangiales bacterium]